MGLRKSASFARSSTVAVLIRRGSDHLRRCLARSVTVAVLISTFGRLDVWTFTFVASSLPLEWPRFRMSVSWSGLSSATARCARRKTSSRTRTEFRKLARAIAREGRRTGH